MIQPPTPRDFAKILLLILPFTWAVLRADPPEPIEGGFTLAVIPDTQVYAWKFPETYRAQMRWLAANAGRYNIVYSLHVGDVTQHNSEEEWKVAKEAHSYIIGTVPCSIVPGNHDMGENGKMDSRQSRLSEFFTPEELRAQPGFGEVYDREPESVDNSVRFFTAGGIEWLILALEYAPRDDVLRWANEVLTRHPERSVIILTHAYLQANGRRYDRTFTLEKHIDRGAKKLTGGVNDGEDIWRKVASQHKNVVLVVCGHVGISASLDSIGVHGNTVHQMVVDYQSMPDGGGGVVRLLQFSPMSKTVRVRDYSPVTDQTETEADRCYEFQIGLQAVPGDR